MDYALGNWKDWFDAIILARGLDYYLAGKVNIISQDKKAVCAVVDGTGPHYYRVKITFANHRPQSISCNCPYASGDENNCKHMAAVLHALDAGSKTFLEQTEDNDKSISDNSSTDVIQKLISTMSEADVKELLLTEARSNPALCNYIRSFYDENNLDLARLKHEVTKIKQRYADNSGFIDYYNASSFAGDLEIFMEQYLRGLIRQQKYEITFELICHIYYMLGKSQIDDSNGELTMLADLCVKYWQEVIEKCTPKERQGFFDWFKNHQYDYVIDCMQCYIDNFLIDNFHEPEMLKQKLEILDQLIARVNSEDDDFDCRLEEYVSARLRVMNELKMSSAEITAFCKEYYHLPAVRQFIIAELEKQGKIEEAIKMLKEGKRIDREWPGLAAEASEHLMQLYQKTGQKQLYRQELEEYLFAYRQSDLKYVLAFKKLCEKDEWLQKRQELLAAQTLCGVKDELMIHEGMYRQLLAKIRSGIAQWAYDDRTVSTLDYYEEVLSANDPEAVRDLYVDFVCKNSEYANGRAQYQMLVDYLHKIEQYPLGKDLVKQIVAEWRANYSRRFAMMDELKRGGF